MLRSYNAMAHGLMALLALEAGLPCVVLIHIWVAGSILLD